MPGLLAVTMVEQTTGRWYLYSNNQTTGPFAWEDLERQIRAGKSEGSALVVAEGGQAWEPFQTMAARFATAPPPTPAVLDPIEQESIAFCEAAARLGLVTAEQMRTALEEQGSDRGKGQSKPIRHYFEKSGVLTRDQIAAVLEARELSGEAALGGQTVALSVHELQLTPSSNLPTAPHLTGLLQDLKSLKFTEILPLSAVFEGRTWLAPWIWLVAFLGISPVVIEIFSLIGIPYAAAAWMAEGYFAALWGILLYLLLKPRWPGTAFLLAMGGCILFAGSLMELLAVKMLSASASSAVLLFFTTCVVSTLEEAIKAAPLYWRYVAKGRAGGATECVFTGTLSGLAYAFACALGDMMLAVTASHTELGVATVSIAIPAITVGALLRPVLHAAWSGIMGYFVGLAVSDRSNEKATVVAGFGVCVLIHLLYQPRLSGWLGALGAMVAVGAFVLYARVADVAAESHPQAEPTAGEPPAEGAGTPTTLVRQI